MARKLAITFLRTTRANLDIQKTAMNLNIAEPYWVSDEGRISVGTSANTYTDMPNASDLGDTVAPATNTADYLPQWNGADSKTLKNGVAIPAGGLAGLTALATAVSQVASIVSKTDSFTLAITDIGALVRVNKATAITLTVPNNTTVDIPIKTVIDIEQTGAGAITVVGETGVVVSAFGGLKSAGKFAGLSLVKVDTNVWTLFGGIA